jgi:D-galactarolactone isomerase
MTEVPKVPAPPRSCDTHMHFYDRAVPPAPGGPALPGHYTVPMYQELQKRLGLERVIVVQPNAYQYDNRVTLSAIAELGTCAKGVAVVKPDVAEAEIERLTAAGIRAQRFFALPGGAVGFDRMDQIMARVHPFGWHANIQLNGRDLPQHEAQLRRLPGHFVIDHIGKYIDPVSPEDEAFQALLRLLDTGRCWVKLSAPYESSKSGAPAYGDVARLAHALVKHAPERMLWASNWPHPYRSPIPSSAAMLDLLLEWAPDDVARRRVLVDNPAELYGFPR